MFIARFDSSGNYKWARDFGNGMFTDAAAVAINSSGDVVVGGEFEGTLSFGGGNLTAVGSADLFLVALDAAGSYLWSESFGTPGQSNGPDSVAVDSSGNVLIAGASSGGLDFGGGLVSGDYLAKFRPSGAYSWSTGFAASCDESSPTMAVDAQGDVILAGCFVGTANFGGGTLTSDSSNAFVAKYDSSGSYLWAQQYGDSNDSDVSDVAVDGCGNILVVGSFFGAINFGAGALTGTDTTKSYAFLAKISGAGDGIWSDGFVGSNVDALYPGSLGVDAEGGPTFSWVSRGA